MFPRVTDTLLSDRSHRVLRLPPEKEKEIGIHLWQYYYRYNYATGYMTNTRAFVE
jgi:hypothetical protein